MYIVNMRHLARKILTMSYEKFILVCSDSFSIDIHICTLHLAQLLEFALKNNIIYKRVSF